LYELHVVKRIDRFERDERYLNIESDFKSQYCVTCVDKLSQDETPASYPFSDSMLSFFSMENFIDYL
jgi:hypothetical protein